MYSACLSRQSITWVLMWNIFLLPIATSGLTTPMWAGADWTSQILERALFQRNRALDKSYGVTAGRYLLDNPLNGMSIFIEDDLLSGQWYTSYWQQCFGNLISHPWHIIFVCCLAFDAFKYSNICHLRKSSGYDMTFYKHVGRFVRYCTQMAKYKRIGSAGAATFSDICFIFGHYSNEMDASSAHFWQDATLSSSPGNCSCLPFDIWWLYQLWEGGGWSLWSGGNTSTCVTATSCSSSPPMMTTPASTQARLVRLSFLYVSQSTFKL